VPADTEKIAENEPERGGAKLDERVFDADEEQDEEEAPPISLLACGVCGRDGFVGARGLKLHRAKNPVQ
jgi:hypothetical protein